MRKGIERFLAILILEPLYGCLLAIAVARLRARIADARMEIAVSLLTPFAAYLLPEHLGGSRNSCHCCGGNVYRRATVHAGSRRNAAPRNFILGNDRLPSERDTVPDGRNRAAKRDGAQFSRRPHTDMGHYDWLYGSGSTFPLVFTTAVVIVATLVVQGTALGPLVRILGVSKDAERDQEALEEQQFFGKEQAARAALDRLSSLQKRRRGIAGSRTAFRTGI
jgi:hypothetical protein